MPPSSPRTGRLAIGTAEHYRWLHGIVQCVLVLNLVDAVLTLFWVGGGLAREANPFIAELVEEHPVGFVAMKTALVAGGSWLLWERREHPYAVVAIFAGFVAYYAVLVHHVQYASGLVGQLLRAV